MHQCYELASTLDSNEWKRFFVFLSKHGVNEDLQQFCFALRAAHPHFQIDQEAVFASAFPGRKFDEPRLRVMRTYMKDALQQFLVSESLQQDTMTSNKILMRQLLDRGQLVQANKLLEQMQAAMEASGRLGLDQMELGCQLDELGLELFARQSSRKHLFDWQRLAANAQQYALARKMRYLCAMQGGSGTLSEDLRERISACLHETKSLSGGVHPYLRIYFHLLAMIGGEDLSDHFEPLKVILSDHAENISFTERTNLFGLLVNYLLTMDHQGDARGLPAAFHIYKEMLAQGLVFGQGRFSVNTARNIASIGTRMGEIEWTKDFLENARHQLDPEYSGNLYHYGLAYIAYVEQRYGEAKRQLQHISHDDPYYKLATDGLLLRIGYEAMDEELFDAIRHAIQRYLHRKDIIRPTMRTGFKNLLYLIGPMYRLRWHPQTAKWSAEVLWAKREEMDALVFQDWVHAKLEELRFV